MKVDFKKNADGLVPAVIQDHRSRVVLMLGYMNQEALRKTRESGMVTFYSRSRKELWTKGEESGNFLWVKEIRLDCDNDSILISVSPAGPVCHTGSDTCWNEINKPSYGFITKLESVIGQRKSDANPESSYVAGLFKEGINKIAQKVGEEAVETIIEAKDKNDKAFLEESADLLFHYLILLQARDRSFEDVVEVLRDRHRS